MATGDAVAGDLARVGREVVLRGLTWGTSGNLSARAGQECFLISASGVRLDDLAPARLAMCAVSGPAEPAGPRPSVEVEMHRAVYTAVPEAGAVAHTSALYTTLLACSRLRVEVDMNTDALAFVGPVARVPYRHPGSVELGRAVAQRAPRSRALLLSNHGSLVWGRTLDEVLRRTEALEFLSRLLVAARAARIPLARLSPEDVAAFPAHP